jgi:hypothetical protein
MAAQTTTVRELSGRVDVLKITVDKHDDFINGNGKPGAKTRLDMLDDAVEEIKSTLRALTKAAWGLASAIIIAGAAWFLFQLLPSIVVNLNH